MEKKKKKRMMVKCSSNVDDIYALTIFLIWDQKKLKNKRNCESVQI